MCNDCFKTQKELNEQLAIILPKAQVLALENNCNVFIYKTPEGWSYMAEEPARQLGIQPTWGIVQRPDSAVISVH